RLTEIRCESSLDQTVSSAQSVWAPWYNTCLPVAASKARTVLSPQPSATRVPSTDQLAPYTVSYVTLTESCNSPLSTSQICNSPNRPGEPPVTANRRPSGENRADSIRSD